MKSLYLAAVVPLLLMVGCAASYPDYSYLPHPGLAEIPSTQPSQPPVVTTSATVVGINWPADQTKAPVTLGTRLRLHNNGPDAVTFDPHSISLSTGELVQFPAPILNATSPLTLAPGDTAMISADFPFPDGRTPEQLDLSTLQLRWSVRTVAGNAEQTLNFQRHFERSYYYERPYWGDPYYYGYGYPYPVVGGAVIIHGR